MFQFPGPVWEMARVQLNAMKPTTRPVRPVCICPLIPSGSHAWADSTILVPVHHCPIAFCTLDCVARNKTMPMYTARID